MINMKWLVEKGKFILGLLAALSVLYLSLQSKRHNNKRLQHEDILNTLKKTDDEIGLYGTEILKHSYKVAKHVDAAAEIKKKAEAKIKKIKEQDNETISSLADSWNTTQ